MKFQNYYQDARDKMEFIEEFYPRREPVYSSYREEDEYEEDEGEEDNYELWNRGNGIR